MNYKLVIFDWDGTLVDSTERIVDSMQRAAEEVGLPEVTDSAVLHIIGLGLPQALRTVWPSITDDEIAKMTPVYARYFVHDSDVAMNFFPDVEELLIGLMDKGYQLAVATGKSRKGLDRMLDSLHIVGQPIRHCFATTRCADETASKPDPLMLSEILEELSVAASEAVMIGDTCFDLDMANALNMDAVAMTQGAHSDEMLLASKPITMCSTINELNQWIQTHG